MKRSLIAAVVAVALLMLGASVLLSQRGSDGAPSGDTTVTRGRVVIDFAGASNPRPKVSKDFAVPAGSSAWEALKQALGSENISAKDSGPGLGMFVTGFYGVSAAGNQFWELIINGKPAELGVSSYIVKSGDVLEFRISTF